MSRELAKEARRRQLIEATIDGIARKGFTELKIADVAAEAGLSVGIVNFYFKSKDALLIATFKHLVEDYEQHMQGVLAKAGKIGRGADRRHDRGGFRPAPMPTGSRSRSGTPSGARRAGARNS